MAIPRIKICGIQNLQEATLCLQAGADSLGFLLEVTHRADDSISIEHAKHIVSSLPPTANTVMVTHSLAWQRIVDVANEANVTAIQIHDDLSVEGVIQLRRHLPALTLLKAVHVPFIDATLAEKEAAMEKAELYAAFVDGLVLDSRTRDRLGGTGLTHDWCTSRRIVERVKKPVILAGGINPSNVEKSIIETACYGIDVNSGVENSAGGKELDKVLAYCNYAAKVLELPAAR